MSDLAIAIELSGREGSVALAVDGRVIDERYFEHGLKHAAGVLPLIDGMLREAGKMVGDVNRVDVSIGPGSFTGLRIAVTLAKTWAYARGGEGGVKVVAVPSPLVLAQNVPGDVPHVATVLDAKRGQIFCGCFSRDAEGRLKAAREPMLTTLEEVLRWMPRPLGLIGEGLPGHLGSVGNDIMEGVMVCPAETWRAKASELSKLGAEYAARGEYADALGLVPKYIRLPEAEEKWQERQGT